MGGGPLESLSDNPLSNEAQNEINALFFGRPSSFGKLVLLFWEKKYLVAKSTNLGINKLDHYYTEKSLAI